MPFTTTDKAYLTRQLLACEGHWKASETAQAAVLFTLCPSLDRSHTLLTQRTDTLPLHPGQISFPGGRREAQDLNPEATALRETQEEIGLSPDRVELLGRLPDVLVSSGIMVTPVVGWCEQTPPLQPNPGEVAAVIQLPLTVLLDLNQYQRGERQIGDQLRQFLFLQFESHYVWGATARILHSFACALGEP